MFHHFSCGLTVLRSDGSQYNSRKTLTITEKTVEEICPTPSTTTPAPTPTTPAPTPTTSAQKLCPAQTSAKVHASAPGK